MIKHNILFIGLDTHKVSTEAAFIEDQRGAKPVHHGKIKTTKAAILIQIPANDIALCL